ncbi:hypothetical protein CHLRE_01g022800v5 [Chlamydomonas reinhardtii]|uniref:Uncharacterized protein n=1 Tax=Chlamydomonas reinhardtii TaxID=3055 RepID=A0A2K3E685_CHLRE|nr:uncharacterized protein CHLRE_01g022800v5 [Chlamydomonas reinhardtii]PNW88290.1 hypothetical protein CHLRE_01g022800v5 [Chlamydomonas reinhardtii]
MNDHPVAGLGTAPAIACAGRDGAAPAAAAATTPHGAPSPVPATFSTSTIAGHLKSAQLAKATLAPQDRDGGPAPPPPPPGRPPPPLPPPSPPPPTRLQSWEEVLGLLRGFSETHLLVGFGDVAQYADVGAAVAELEPRLDEVQRRTAGRWLLLYGGDPTTPAKPNVGVLVRLLAERWGCPVLAPIIDTRATGSSSCGQPPLQQPLQPASSQAHLTYYYVLPAQYSDDVDREAAAASDGAATAAVTTTPGSSSNVISGSSILGKRRAEAEPEAEGAGVEAAAGRVIAAPGTAGSPAVATIPAAAMTGTGAAAVEAAAPAPDRGSILWGGLRHGRPVGASAFYLHDDLLGLGRGKQKEDGGGGGGSGGDAPPRRLLTSVIAAGGGDIAVQELQYLHERGVPCTYVPCPSRFPPAHYTSPFGPVHDWAAATRGMPPSYQPPPPLQIEDAEPQAVSVGK